MRIRHLALALLVARAATAQLIAAPDASPVGAWRGTSVCVVRRSACHDEVVIYKFALKGSDSLSLDALKIVDGREDDMGTLACELNAPRAFVTCDIPNGKWRFTVRHDSLVGQLRLRDGTWFRDVHAVRSPAPRSGNPILPGWYADPEAHVFAGQYWIYPTYSAPYDQQTFMDAFSSHDLVTWTKHERIIDTASVKWARRAMWAPSIVEKNGRYYLFFGANDIQSDSQPGGGGIGVAVSDKPEGPFRDLLGRPLIDKFHNGAQPIDQMVFRDYDGAYYIIYGGWRHCNIARLNDDFTGFVPFADGTTFREITPKGYVEGAYMLLKDGKYYFMWSEGGWTGPNYSVAYAVGTSPTGPFERVGKILQQDSTVATGAGHHSILHVDGSPNWYIVYHRRPLGETDRNHRVVSIDELHFDSAGLIEPVKITKGGVAPDPYIIRR